MGMPATSHSGAPKLVGSRSAIAGRAACSRRSRRGLGNHLRCSDEQRPGRSVCEASGSARPFSALLTFKALFSQRGFLFGNRATVCDVSSSVRRCVPHWSPHVMRSSMARRGDGPAFAKASARKAVARISGNQTRRESGHQRHGRPLLDFARARPVAPTVHRAGTVDLAFFGDGQREPVTRCPSSNRFRARKKERAPLASSQGRPLLFLCEISAPSALSAFNAFLLGCGHRSRCVLRVFSLRSSAILPFDPPPTLSG
jgi:hypothetical protein